ncbi:MAG: hypothetical protein RI958_987 [Actinomycetota bacterium]|jgi:plastocyanin
MRSFSGALVALAALSVVSCGGSDPTVSTSPPSTSSASVSPSSDASTPASGDAAEPVAPNGLSVEVQSLDNSFRAQDITIAAGTEVVFVNVGRNVHNVIPEPDSIGGWGVGEEDFEPGDEYRHVFDVPGLYAYVCTIHGVNGKGMVGTVTVTD